MQIDKPMPILVAATPHRPAQLNYWDLDHDCRSKFRKLERIPVLASIDPWLTLVGTVYPASVIPTACYDASAKRVRQHGHSPSMPFVSARNAVGCGRVIIAL